MKTEDAVLRLEGWFQEPGRVVQSLLEKETGSYTSHFPQTYHVFRTFLDAPADTSEFDAANALVQKLVDVIEVTLGRSILDLMWALRGHKADWTSGAQSSYWISQGLTDALVATDLDTRLEGTSLRMPSVGTFYIEPASPMDCYDVHEGRGMHYRFLGASVRPHPDSLSMILGIERNGVELAVHIALRFDYWEDVEDDDPFVQPFAFIVNTILYLTGEAASMTVQSESPRAREARRLKGLGPKKRKKRERKLTRYASTSRYLVGLDVHYSPAPSPRGDGDHTLMRRHEVRGHWKWQACGVRRTERRHIWVRPYMRGTDLAGRIHKTYADKPEEALPEEET